MSSTYDDFAEVCTAFYDLILDPNRIAEFVFARLERFSPSSGLFVGSFFLAAKHLIESGLNLTVCDYAYAMVEEGRKRLPAVDVLQADLRALPFHPGFDCVVVIGRVFTHMLTDDEAGRALGSLSRSLRPGGILFFDNYEDTKIRVTDYFNGQVQASDARRTITRTSSTERVSDRPYVVNWQAVYQVVEPGRERSFQDEMLHRAFSREEIRRGVESHGLRVVEQGDNFDETSFYTLAQKIM